MSRWISVKDKLPETYETYDFTGESVEVSRTVIVNIIERSISYTCCAVYMKQDGWITESWDSSEVGRPLSDVTHWMVLPDPIKRR